MGVCSMRAEELRWLDLPPEEGLAAARSLLQELGALDNNSHLTAPGETPIVCTRDSCWCHLCTMMGGVTAACILRDYSSSTGRADCKSDAGERMARLGEHPRLAAMLLQAQALGIAHLGCLLAAVVSEGSGVLPRESVQSADISVPLAALLLQLNRPMEGITPLIFDTSPVSRSNSISAWRLPEVMLYPLPGRDGRPPILSLFHLNFVAVALELIIQQNSL